MHGSSLRRRVETYSVASFVAGLAWWYLGGSSAITGMLVATPVILGGIASGCVVALALTVALRRDGLRQPAELPYADGCTKGSTGVVTQHTGAFGFAWTTTPRCPPAPP